MPQQRVADLALVVAGADDGDRGRGEQARDRPGLAALLALVGDRQRVVGLLDRERQVDDAVLVLPGGLVARVPEDPDHPAVLGQHLGDEPLDAPLAPGRRQVLEQDRAQPAALVRVLHEEGDLGVVGAGIAVEAPHPDDLVAEQYHEGHPVDVVDVGEPVQVAVRQLFIGPKKR